MASREEAVPVIRTGVSRLARRLRAERPDHALTANAVGVLAHLHRHGPSTPGAVAAAEHQRPQSLTRTYAELAARGLISRTAGDRDRRESVLAITPAGRRALGADMALRDAWLEGALESLTDAEVEIVRIAAELMDRLAGTTSGRTA
ncbi:MarR family winged helix-turn-helix transcriptional regulator [Actinomadura parmotrematis]|uniref:MarR family transcriptional regulator n=1 Tax=Actinomadura parmotrematis TaxID=2864039 RepID=A0ABS7FQE3_9ACTN|nr:MarR family transcriptional regulator [Actinomadura parmotrematis]MBW8482586.1 MarR family transcriptional regulator [Actinomadura parmotrematis]